VPGGGLMGSKHLELSFAPAFVYDGERGVLHGPWGVYQISMRVICSGILATRMKNIPPMLVIVMHPVTSLRSHPSSDLPLPEQNG
jgi:hypothetical protein